MQKIDFNVSGTQGAGAVSVNANFTGGLSMVTDTFPVKKPNVHKIQATGSYDVNGNPVLSQVDEFEAYRSYCLFDCIALRDKGGLIYTSLEGLKMASSSNNFAESFDPQIRLVEISMSVSQTYEFKATAQSSDMKRTDINGPRFVALTDRVVTGHLKYYSPEKTIEKFDGSALTLYFGGPYLFPLPSVDWMPPKMTAKSEEGYVYEYAFIAKVPTSIGISGSGNIVSAYSPAPIVAVPGMTTDASPTVTFLGTATSGRKTVTFGAVASTPSEFGLNMTPNAL